MPLLHVGVGGPSWLDWSVHLDALILVIVLAYAYYYAVRELRPRVSDAGRVKRSQVILFAAGLGSLYLAGGTPIHDLGEQYLFSAHMVQHLLFTLAAPPLLIAGTPGWLWRWLLRRPVVYPIARIVTKPLIAFSVFNGLLVVTHLPPVVDLALNVGAFHFFVHAVLVVTAMLMWWPLLSPLPELPRLSYPLQVGYLFVQSLLPAIIASFITFADSPVYAFYEDAPQLWGISAVADQQVAGGMMKLVGGVVFMTYMTVVFFRWFYREQAEEAGPAWEDVEVELQELGLEGQSHD